MIKHIFKLMWNKKQENALIILEILVAFLILCGVLVFAIYNLQQYREPLGYQTKDIWIVNLSWPLGADSAQIIETKDRLKSEIRELPNILDVGYCMSSTFPLGGGVWTMSDKLENGLEYSTHYIEADEKFSDILGLEVSEGRWYTKADYEDKYAPVVINEKLRNQLFKDTVALGQILKFSGEKKVIGVVKNLKYYGEFGEEPNIAITNYVSATKNDPIMAIKLKAGTEASFEEELNETIRRVAKNWPFTIINYDSRRIAKSQETWVPLLAMIAISGFLILNVALGLFGVLWQNIQKRRGEVGLRQAMGATRAKIYRQFIMEMIILTSMGILLGLVFTLQFPLLKVIEIENQVYLLAMVATAVLIYLLVLFCSFYPSRQASLIQPAVALHEE